jgi:hypothetical protein
VRTDGKGIRAHGWIYLRTDDAHGYNQTMADEEKDAAAQSMAAKRWAKTTEKQRSEVAKKLNEARWGKKGSRKKKKKA